MTRRLVFCSSVLALGVCLGCPSGTDTPEPEGETDHGPIDFTAFGQDRHAVGGDWYAYNEAAGHVLTPFEQAYIIRDDRVDDPSAFAAVSLSSYYDPDTAESGVFTFSYAVWDGADWGAPTEVATPNIKSDGPYCIDLFAGAERDCGTDDSWQMQLRIYRFFVQTGPLVVARPGLFLNQVDDGTGDPVVYAATYETTLGLSDLPDPTGLDDLATLTPADFDDPTFDYARFAADLPTAGRVLGTRFAGPGFTALDDVFFVQDGLERFVTMQIAPASDGDPSAGIDVTYTIRTLDAGEKTIPTDEVEAETVTVPMPDPGEVQYVSFATADLEVEASAMAAARPPNVPPTENTWSFALEWDGPDPSIRLSSAAALYNATFEDNATGLDALPPTD